MKKLKLTKISECLEEYTITNTRCSIANQHNTKANSHSYFEWLPCSIEIEIIQRAIVMIAEFIEPSCQESINI